MDGFYPAVSLPCQVSLSHSSERTERCDPQAALNAVLSTTQKEELYHLEVEG